MVSLGTNTFEHVGSRLEYTGYRNLLNHRVRTNCGQLHRAESESGEKLLQDPQPSDSKISEGGINYIELSCSAIRFRNGNRSLLHFSPKVIYYE